MAEDKLQEKRLKERARRNGMASSIDEMRLLVPELIEAKKNYSQAKVVAFALAHIYDLQSENDEMRGRLGLKPRLEEYREKMRAQGNGKHKKDRAPAGERGRKRRRLADSASGEQLHEAVVVAAATAQPAAAVTAATNAAAAATAPAKAAAAVTLPPPPTTLTTPLPGVSTRRSSAALAAALSIDTSARASSMSLENDESAEMEMFVADSLAASPALSPHPLDDESGMPFAHSNFDNFEHTRPVRSPPSSFDVSCLSFLFISMPWTGIMLTCSTLTSIIRRPRRVRRPRRPAPPCPLRAILLITSSTPRPTCNKRQVAQWPPPSHACPPA